ncbi:MAG: methionine--tRNA ligase [Firmicutes bacterium]|nr:methionine--tRNA ligase [Bacillota bacterium]
MAKKLSTQNSFPPIQKPTYYITTPIYYPSGKWHLGHSYTTVCCDALARFKRMSGFDVYYLTGTDEHGQKIEERAAAAGLEPKAFVDGLVGEIKVLWKLLGISNDGFIRTTDENHKAAIQRIFTTLYEKGDIYKSKYKGRYCTPCESFWTASQLKEGDKCPDCGRDTVEAEEDCYFFRLSKYREPLLKLLTESDFLQPASRVNEMVNNFLAEEGMLEDLAVSRTSFRWGIPVPFDDGHIVYVWVDALSNYITALGYGSDDDALFQKYWPADLQMMAKEIVRFHSIIWPALLMGLGVPLPKKVYGHGWLLFSGGKMSKSVGNVVDPFILCNRYGVDAVRYYLLREISFGQDCDYATENLLTRCNTDLCNDLGNLVKRTTAMARQYFGGKVTKSAKDVGTEFDAALIEKINALHSEVSAKLEKLEISRSLETLFDLVSSANKYIDLTKPWALFKETKNEERKTKNDGGDAVEKTLNAVLYNLLEAIRVSANMLLPFIQNAPAKIFASLGLPVPDDFSAMKYGAIDTYQTTESEVLFARLDVKKELEELELLTNNEKRITNNVGGDGDKEPNAKSSPEPRTPNPESRGKERSDNNMITIDEFAKLELKTAVVTACEKVEKADKLLKLTLDVGGQMRTVVSGIAASYAPADLIGRQVVLVCNLQPAKLRGIESQGMILCAVDENDKPVIVEPGRAVPSGSTVR